MKERIQDTLEIVEIQDTKKLKKEKKGKKTKLVKIEVRRVTIQDEDKTFKITLTQEKQYHLLKKLEMSDLHSSVEVDLNLSLSARQATIESFNPLPKESE